jgi:hypothetical protein
VLELPGVADIAKYIFYTLIVEPFLKLFRKKQGAKFGPILGSLGGLPPAILKHQIIKIHLGKLYLLLTFITRAPCVLISRHISVNWPR